MSQLHQNLFTLQFHLPSVVITADTSPSHLAFYFQGHVLFLSLSGTWSDSMYKDHIFLQELQAVLMLCRMVFHLSGEGVALHLDYNTTKAYLWNQGHTVSFVFSRLAS